MAFEDVFRGLDFQAPVRARQREQEMMMQAIGQGLGAYERGQERELKTRQLEQKASQLDLGQVAQEALFKQAQGVPLTPQDTAAIQAFSTLKGAQTFIDPMTQQMVTKPALAERAGLMGQQFAPQPSRLDAMVSPQQDIVPRDIEPSELEQLLGVQPQIRPQAPPLPQEAYRAPPKLGARGTIMEEEFKRDIAKEAVGGDITLDIYEGKKEIDSVYAGEKLNKASLAKQGSYENLLSDILAGYETLISTGAAVETLGAGAGIGDVASNIAARVGASGVGQALGGAVGTKAQGARDEINRVLPMMFGDLRVLMGMTGKELDTPQERDFYLRALSDPKTNMGTNLNIIEGLSKRFGSGKTAEKIDAVRGTLSGGYEMSPTKKLERLRELRAKQ